MSQNKFIAAGQSVLSSKDNTTRKVVKVKPLKCWVEDYEKEICIPFARTYHIRYDANDKPVDFDTTVQYKLYVPLRSNTEITVEVRFKITGGMDTHDNFKRLPIEEALAIKPTVEAGVAAWNEHFQLQITDPKCGKRTLPIHYTCVWTEENPHYEISVAKSNKKARVAGDTMLVSPTVSTTTITHEYAHCIGLPDEYMADDGAVYVKYIKPDGTLDKKIKLLRDLNEDMSDASFMSVRDADILLRHAWNIAIEAQQLLREKLERKITCDILWSS